jgi:signal transduction histidine kinase
MNNIIKHARASCVEMRLDCMVCIPGETESQHPKRITLCVMDDGKGFFPEDVSADHLGIGIMYERAESIGAEIAIVSQPGEGTRLTVTWEANNEGESDEHAEKNSCDDR